MSADDSDARAPPIRYWGLLDRSSEGDRVGILVQLRPLTRVKPTRRVLEHWRETEPALLVRTAIARLLPDVRLGALTVMGAARVYPGAVADSAPVDRLRLVFVSAAPIRDAWRALVPLTAFGRCIVVVPAHTRVSPMQLAELDFQGIAAIRTLHAGGAEWLVEGADGPHPDALVPGHWRRHREEQVADYLHRYCPARDGSLAIHAAKKFGGSHSVAISEPTSHR